MRSLISGVMALAIEDKVVGVNPAARSGKYLKAAKKAREAEFLTPEEIRLLLCNARGIFYPFFLTAVRKSTNWTTSGVGNPQPRRNQRNSLLLTRR